MNSPPFRTRFSAYCDGGGRYADVKNISISGGTVYAEASELAAAIGSGMAGICENISISGGVVNAKANSYGAAIGTGAYDAVEDGIEKPPFADGIYISGGQLHIEANAYASAGIGSGSGFSKNIFLSGGTIIVETSETGIAVGNRENGYDAIDIQISGGNIHASTFSNCKLVNDKGAAIAEHQIMVGTDHAGEAVAQVNVPGYGTKDMYVDNEAGNDLTDKGNTI